MTIHLQTDKGTLRRNTNCFRRLVVMAMAMISWLGTSARGEIIFQDSFNQGSGGVTNSVPFLDVQGDGWQVPAGEAALTSDGQGHLTDAMPSGGAGTVGMIPIGPHGSMTLTATVQLPMGSPNWIGVGLVNSNQTLNGADSQSGPWVLVNNDGSMDFYGGAGANHPTTFANAWTNDGTPVTVSLKYDAFDKTVSGAVIDGGTTNNVFSSMPVTTSLSSVNARYAGVEFSATDTVLTNRWVSGLAVDWYPRPFPMLTLPVASNSITIYSVPAPTGTNDINEIQDALDYAATHAPAEIQFEAGGLYMLTNNVSTSSIPLTLTKGTNVVIDGNGCEILIRNPRMGFLHLQSCSNVIVKDFTVDYDPLPFTQGVVTSNLYTFPPASGAESAIEFRPDDGYPVPTNDDYADHGQERWGTIMNTNYPGRGADDRHTIYIYSNATATEYPGIFKVEMPNPASVSTIQAGDFWCMVSRWNGSSVYSAANSYQITFLNLTDYTGAAANFEASDTPLVNEIDCHVAIGPLPAGATRGRIKSSNADGGYFGDSRIGPWVEDCDFTGLSDDVANAYTSPFVTTNAPDYATNTFSLWVYNTSKEGGPPGVATAYELRVGDQLDFFNAATGVIFDQAVITNVDLPYVSVDHPIANIVNGTYETNTLVYDNSLNTSAVYLNNQFSNSRIHGIYCRANNMLIAHNSISGMGLSAISGFPALDLTSPNSFTPTNVMILDNVMSDCSYSYDAIHNNIPDEEPAFALVELHQTLNGSDYVPGTFGISGIRILNNVFLNWRRAPLSLHNVEDVRIQGNYFGPPLTADGLVPLEDDVVGDLWSCDYGTMVWGKNINATGLADDNSIYEDNNQTVVTKAFEKLSAPQLNVNTAATNVLIGWSSVAPAFVVQASDSLLGADWTTLTNGVSINGASNSISVPMQSGAAQTFYRTIQR